MKSLLIKIILALTTFLGFLYVYFNLPAGKNTGTKAFTVNSGDTIVNIATRLEDLGYIRNRYYFILTAYRMGLNKKLQAGNFNLSSNLTTDTIVGKLSQPGRSDYWLTIVEGLRVEQIADLFVGTPIDPSEFYFQARDSEGKLFPDTYSIPDYFTASDAVKLFTNNFSKKVNRQITTEDLITASLVEREARSENSRKIVAGIIKNRLELGMPLQLDASVQYGLDSGVYKIGKDYWGQLNSDDLKKPSPYNTYLNNGLPPSPICNPSLSSIQAVLSPTATDYLYYITGNDNQMHYARTLEEHNQNIAKYLR